MIEGIMLFLATTLFVIATFYIHLMCALVEKKLDKMQKECDDMKAVIDGLNKTDDSVEFDYWNLGNDQGK